MAEPAAPRPACALLAAYLTLTAPPLALAAVRGGGPARLALPAHLALLVLAAWGARRPAAAGPRTGAAVAAWLPLAAVPLLYAGLPALATALHTILADGSAATLVRVAPMHDVPMHDARVIAWEHAVFGSRSPAVGLAGRWPSLGLSELLHLGYLSYYLVIYLPPLVLWRAGRRGAFAASVFTVLLAFVACYAVFLTFPVQGPWYTWPHPRAVPGGPVRAFVERLLTAGASRGTAFPSSHVAVSVAQTLALAQAAPRLAAPAGVATLLLALGAVYGGFHYGVDVLAGAVVGAAVGALGPRLWRRAAAAEPAHVAAP